MHPLSSLIATKVEVNKVFEVQAEKLQIHSKIFDRMIDIPLPQSHNGLAPVSCRLVSAKRRKGMVKSS